MTAQVREIIYINGKEEQMAAEPLAPFLAANPQIQLTFPNTACWRGYYGTWSLEDDKLYLLDFKGYLEGPDGETVPMDLQDIFPDEKIVFAKWFSGIIKIEQGKLLEYVHSGYESNYERDLFLIFEDGVKVDEYFIDNTQSK